jgi:hypothetical protein
LVVAPAALSIARGSRLVDPVRACPLVSGETTLRPVTLLETKRLDVDAAEMRAIDALVEHVFI